MSTNTDDVSALSGSELRALLESRESSSVELVEALLARIEDRDGGGHGLHSVLELHPRALEIAERRDSERSSGKLRGPLHGLPVLLKDNIDTAAPLHTSGGSFVFGESSPKSDAFLVRALSDAGAIILGKASLSEWANFRGRPSSSGWNARGGQTRNPHALDRSPGGSSAGSAVAVASRFVPLAVGTETDGSVLCPAGLCGVAGLKPTVGLVSRSGIIPISWTQDTAGPMARTVADLALLLEVMAQSPATGETGVDLSRPAAPDTRYLGGLGDGNLKGLTIGVLREGGFAGYHTATDRLFDDACRALADSGAAVVDPVAPPPGFPLSSEDEHVVLTYEFARAAASYFLGRRQGDESGLFLPSSLEDVIEHARSDRREEISTFGIELLEDAVATAGADASSYERARSANLERARLKGLDRLFAAGQVDLVAVPTTAPAWLTDHLLGDQVPGAGWSPPAVAGYPSATLPIGLVGGMPVGLTLWAPPYEEMLLLRAMYGLERQLGTAITAPMPRFADHAANA